MSKDDVIARFVYNTTPPTYQSARFTDWMLPYLASQRAETEKSGSYTSYFKHKYESVLKALIYFKKFEIKAEEFQKEQQEAYELQKLQHPEEFEDIEKNWLAYRNKDVIAHFPPQLVVGRQVQEDKEIMVFDEHPNVKVTLIEVACEYNYSNPTGFFNISLPHLEARTTMYQTMSYQSQKRLALEAERAREIRDRLEKEDQEKAATLEAADASVSTDATVAVSV